MSTEGRGNGHYDGPMPRQMTATEVKSRILTLLDEVSEGEAIEITKHGRTIARLVPAQGPHALKGRFAGVATSAIDDDDLFATEAAWDLG